MLITDPADLCISSQMQEVAVLLSLMIAQSAEHPQLIHFYWWGCEEVELKSDVLLDNVRHVMKQLEVRLSLPFPHVYLHTVVTVSIH